MFYLLFLFYFLFVLILFSEVGEFSEIITFRNKIWEVYAMRKLFVRYARTLIDSSFCDISVKQFIIDKPQPLQGASYVREVGSLFGELGQWYQLDVRRLLVQFELTCGS